MSVTTRFAPSPTGRLHVGNIRTALHNFLFASKHGGEFLLRIDDTDRERSTPEFDEAIRKDLDWLGLTPARIFRQSERFDIYEQQFARLKEAGRVYACYETPDELELRRKVLLGRGLPRSTSGNQQMSRRPKAASRIGGSSSITMRRSSLPTWSEASSGSIPSC